MHVLICCWYVQARDRESSSEGNYSGDTKERCFWEKQLTHSVGLADD